MDMEKQGWLAKYATGPSHDNSAPRTHTTKQITTILRDQFGISPKRRTISYTKPYPGEYDLIPLPPKYRIPEFTKFSGSEGSSSIEHESQYLAQLGKVSVSDPMRVSHKASFWMVHFIGPGFDSHLEAVRRTVSYPVSLRGC